MHSQHQLELVKESEVVDALDESARRLATLEAAQVDEMALATWESRSDKHGEKDGKREVWKTFPLTGA